MKFYLIHVKLKVNEASAYMLTATPASSKEDAEQRFRDVFSKTVLFSGVVPVISELIIVETSRNISAFLYVNDSQVI